ncbi:MAG: CRTAC1 family protein [Verrucomicrobia bacterium]|nr:CRTAC1 family protein [Verrucomicrobiota bacterium]
MVSCVILASGWLEISSEGKDLEWRTEGGVRWADLEKPKQGKTGFTLLPPANTGIAFTNTLDEASGAANRVLYNGSGVAVGDFDSDGWPDIFFCNLAGQNALFKNLGNLRFKEVTAAAGLGAPCPLTRGAVFADINGDGHLDLLISVTGRGVRCFLNDRAGKFVDATAAAGTASKFGSATMALADVEGNGTLDLYIANNWPDDIRDRGRVSMSLVNGRPVLPGAETNRFLFLNGRLEECGQPDQLLLNDGTGRFKPTSWTDGTFLDEAGRRLAEPPLDWGLTATFRDVNDDRAPDLYVCNDYWTPDRFWINDGRGRFRALEPLALRKTAASSMSVDFADIDRDGAVDCFVVDMLSRDPHLRRRQMFAQMPRATPVGGLEDRPQVMRNTLFLQRQDGSFAEAAFYANVFASDWSWTAIFLDVDLDGYEDLVIGAGHFRDLQDYDAERQIQARQHSWAGFKNEAERQQAFTRELMEHYHLYPTLHLPIVAFRNRGDCTFEETTELWGLSPPGVHQGLALADFDQDGDLDLVVNNLNGPAALYRSESSAARVAVRLKGKAPNTQGIGAKVALLNGAVAKQTTEVICGGRYQSGSDTMVVFAAGPAATGMTLEVRWWNGQRSVVPNVQAGRLYEIDEATVSPAPANATPTPPSALRPPPLFEDVSGLLAHKHHETEFNDYERQPLLPFKLSQLGPGVAWVDLDGDGREDLVVGTGRGGAPAVFRSDGRGKFSPCGPEQTLLVRHDTAGLVGWTDPSGARVVLAGLTGYEATSDHAHRRCETRKDLPQDSLSDEPAQPARENSFLASSTLTASTRLRLMLPLLGSSGVVRWLARPTVLCPTMNGTTGPLAVGVGARGTPGVRAIHRRFVAVKDREPTAPSWTPA